MNRREFVYPAGGGFLSALFCSTSAGKAAETGGRNAGRQEEDLDSIVGMLPNFCAHEHWGSIDAIGTMQGGYRADFEAGAVPGRKTGIMDIVLDPYLGGWVNSTGFSPEDSAQKAGYKSAQNWWDADPEKAFASLKPHLERQQLTGTFQCICRGISFLHGIDIGGFELDAWREAGGRIADAYGAIFTWYRNAMAKSQFTELIRPVHPEFYYSDLESTASRMELSFTRTILRIDPLLSFWKQESPRRKRLSELTGIEPVDAGSWRKFIVKLFDRAAEKGTTGIKQLQAYSRELDFPLPEDGEVIWRGDLNPAQAALFQNWVVNECSRQANERGWVHQVHVGTHNLSESSPMPLAGLARRYPEMKLVMIHCWPFVDEAGWLAKHIPNMYIDTCWMPVLNPEFFRRAMTQWINYVPVHKIICSHDSTSVEMAAGSSLFTREILSSCLNEAQAMMKLSRSSIIRIAADFLQNNAVKVYRYGSETEI